MKKPRVLLLILPALVLVSFGAFRAMGRQLDALREGGTP